MARWLGPLARQRRGVAARRCTRPRGAGLLGRPARHPRPLPVGGRRAGPGGARSGWSPPPSRRSATSPTRWPTRSSRSPASTRCRRASPRGTRWPWSRPSPARPRRWPPCGWSARGPRWAPGTTPRRARRAPTSTATDGAPDGEHRHLEGPRRGPRPDRLDFRAALAPLMHAVDEGAPRWLQATATPPLHGPRSAVAMLGFVVGSIALLQTPAQMMLLWIGIIVALRRVPAVPRAVQARLQHLRALIRPAETAVPVRPLGTTPGRAGPG